MALTFSPGTQPGEEPLSQDTDHWSGPPRRATHALLSSRLEQASHHLSAGDIFAQAVRGLGPQFTGAELRRALVEASSSRI